MKTHTAFAVAACLLIAALPFAHAQGGRARTIDTVVVAERPGPERGTTAASSYLLYDGGYIEEGDPVAGERPPTAGAVRQAVEQTLSSHGFTGATAPEAATVLVTYHYGVLRPRSLTPEVTTRLHPFFRARLGLVTPSRLLERLEDALVLRSNHMPAPELQRVEYRDALQAATGGRYFAILSAYDLAELRRGNQVPLWRVKISTQETSTSMDRAIPALVLASGNYLGQDMRRPTFDDAPLASEAGERGSPAAASTTAIGEDAAGPVRRLIEQEQAMFSGRGGSDADYDLWRGRSRR